MRIGDIMIDTDSMDIETIDTILKELRHVRNRKSHATELGYTLRALFHEAGDDNFIIVEKNTGRVFTEDDFLIYDNE